MHKSDVLRKPLIDPPRTKILQSNPTPSGWKKIPLYLVLKGSKKKLPYTYNAPKPFIFVFYCVLCIIGPIVDLFSTKFSVRTLKCWFSTPGRKFEIFERPNPSVPPKILQSIPLPLRPKCWNRPPQGGWNLIISSTWTLEKALTGSYASLLGINKSLRNFKFLYWSSCVSYTW